MTELLGLKDQSYRPLTTCRDVQHSTQQCSLRGLVRSALANSRSTSDLFSLSFGRMNTSLVWKDRMMREVRTPGEAPPTKNCSFPNLDEEGNGLGVGVKQ